MHPEKPNNFIPTEKESAPAKTKEEWLGFAVRLFKCSIGSKNQIEKEALMDLTRKLIKDAMPFLCSLYKQKWMHANIDIAEYSQPFFIELIRDLVKDVQLENMEERTEKENDQFLQEKEEVISQIANLLNPNSSDSLNDSLVISIGLELLKKSYRFLDGNTKLLFSELIDNLIGRKRYIESNRSDSELNYEEEMHELSEKIKEWLLQMVEIFGS
ncbi:MAG: hypothetical protein ABH896_03630 [Candidatus Jacksonbacteria bacterium]